MPMPMPNARLFPMSVQNPWPPQMRRQEQRAIVVPATGPETQVLIERDRDCVGREWSDGGDGRGPRLAFWELVILALAAAFIIFVSTCIVIIFVRVGEIADIVSGSSLEEKMERLFSHLLATTKNMQDVSQMAVSTMHETQPRLIGAVNDSAALVGSLKQFSSHPSLTFGSMGR